jgi:hypothetical protein
VVISLTPDNHGVDQQFCPDNQSLCARYQGKIAGLTGRYEINRKIVKSSMNKTDLENLVEIRVAEAKILLESKKYEGAYYLPCGCINL